MALAAVTLLIVSVEKTIYFPLSKNQVNQSVSLVASLGLYVIIVNALALLFGTENRLLDDGSISGSFEFDGVILTKIQGIQITGGILAIAGFIAYLKFTKSRLSLQSLSDNRTVSEVLGVNTKKERLRVFIAGSMLACVAAVLKLLEEGVDPQAGMAITLTAIVVTVLVSRLDLFLIFAFAFALTLLQNSADWFLDAQWRNGITYALLLLVIVIRAEGVISYKLRKDGP